MATAGKHHPKSHMFMAPSITDFANFRDTGELSDITVCVEDKEYNLHKFPLFIKSDFFRALARGQVTEKDRVELADFPGGAAVFEQVANFCYNMRLEVDKENVCQVRCAAEFLQMTTPGNLGDVADKYFNDILTAAKLGRNLGGILELMEQCQTLGAIADQAGLIDKCILGIVDCWLISCKFTLSARSRPGGPAGPKLDPLDVAHLKRLTQFPLQWFLQLFVTARDKCVRPGVLATMIEMYITNALQMDHQPQSRGENGNNIEPDADKNTTNNTSKQTVIKPSPDRPVSDEELAKVLDTLLLELPENAPLAETISPQWASRMLKTAAKMDCQCRNLLLKLTARLLHKFSPTDLSDISPDLLSEILNEAGNGGTEPENMKQIQTDQVCAVIDNYLVEQAKKDELSVETFRRMVKAVPSQARDDHDLIFQALETMFNSEKHGPSNDERQELLGMVDCSRLSEATLMKAYDTDLVPKEYITKAAIGLCGRLREQLEEARALIHSQEYELQKYGLGKHTTSHFRSALSTCSLTGASGLGASYSPVRTVAIRRSYPSSPRVRELDSERYAPTVDVTDHCYSSSYDSLYRPRYLDPHDTTVYDTSYVDTYSDLYRPYYGYYTPGAL